MLKIYIYDSHSEYSGESVTTLDPEETKLQGKDVWLMPPNSTTLAPEKRAGYAPVWNGEAWDYIEDHRGETGWVGRKYVEIEELGPLPVGFSTEEPEPTPEERAAWQRQELLAGLDGIDRAASRSIRAVLASLSTGQEPDAADVERLVGYEASAKALRADLAKLN